MPPRNKAKLGLTIPVDPKHRGFDTSYGNNALPSPSTSSSARRNIPRSPPPRLWARPIPPPPPAPTRRMAQASGKKPDTMEFGKEEAEKLESLVHGQPSQRKMSKQLSMSETSTTRDIAWEKRRRQTYRKEKRRNSISIVTPDVDPYQELSGAADGEELTDADLHDLKGSIELGFGFNEEEGQKLCNTLPALDLYFAVNRKLTPSPVSTPRPSLTPLSRISSLSSLDSPRSDQDSWKICGPGDDPQQVKTKLRHWAQAVACSIIQSS